MRLNYAVALFLLCFPVALARAEPPSPPPAIEFRTEVEATGLLPEDLPVKPVPPRRHEQTDRQRIPIVRRILQLRDEGPLTQQGALSGKTVYLSPGHGWVYTDENGWFTQRSNTYGVVEDLGNADGLGQFLVPYLLAAGALVVGARELDPTGEMVILDDSDGAGQPARGRYTESGDSSLFQDSTVAGWGQPGLPITSDSINPFTLGKNRLMTTAPTETARATYILNVPKSGYYNVYISYSMYSARASDARVIVSHPGGQTHFLVDQRRQGSTWVLLGRFYFDQGANEATNAVIFTNESKDPGSNVSLDAVRLGGGMGLIDRGGGVSNQLRTDECHRYHAQFSGAPSSVYDLSGTDRIDDVTTPAYFTGWVHADGEPAVYIAHHTNASNGQARGSLSFIFGGNSYDGTYQPSATALSLGADKLGQAVHGEMISDIQTLVDPNWKDRGLVSANFGAINTDIQPEVPAMLIETAFHDNPEDAAHLKDAGFRRLVARAITQGIIKYFAQKEGTPVFLPPEPPTSIWAVNSGPGKVTVSWHAPLSGGAFGDPAASYRVYRSSHGYAFDNGRDSGGQTSLTIEGLQPGEVVYLRVTATNDGGESLPSPTLAVGVGAGTGVPVLLVSAFDRIDAEMSLKIPYPELDLVDRLFMDSLNNGTYLVQHGRAMDPTDVPFDACTHLALEQERLRVDTYDLVLWQGGKGQSDNLAMGPKAQAALRNAAGTSLIVSSSVFARRADPAFLSEVLHASFATAAQEFFTVNPQGGGALEGMQPWNLSSWEDGPYDVQIPDVLTPTNGGRLAATYEGGGGAVIQHSDGQRCSVLAGFPLETVLPPQQQTTILGRLLDLCDVQAPDGGATPGDGGPGGDGVIGDDDGCGCRLGGPPDCSAPLFLLLLTLLALARRAR